MIFNRFRKPRWQHKDAAVRVRAVAADQDEKLQAALPELATSDPNPGVRLAALKRMDDPRAWSRCVHEDSEEKLREEAARRLQQFLQQTDDADLATAILERHANANWLPALTRARLSVVRLAAARKGGKSSHWREVLEQADEASLECLLDELNDTQLLTELVKKPPKNQKKLLQRLEEKLDAQRLAAGDAATVEKHAQRLCLAYVALSQETRPDILKTRLDELDQLWESLPQQAVAENHQQQRNGARKIALNILLAHDPAHQQKLRQQTHDQAEAWIEQMRRLATDPPEQMEKRQAKFQQLRQQWQTLPEHLLEAETLARWKDAHDLVEHILLPAAEETILPAEIAALQEKTRQWLQKDASALTSRTLTRLEEALIHAKATHTHPDTATAKVLQQVQQQLHRLIERHQQHLGELDKLKEQFQQLLPEMEAALNRGQIQQASKLEQQLSQLTPPLEKQQRLDKDSLKTLSRLRADLKDKRQWLHWSNEDHRKALCEELEAFAGKGAHPDAVREKLQQAWKQWQDLEKSEHPLPGKQRFAASPALWRRFSKIRKRLNEQTQPYFESRQAQQEANLAECQQAMEHMELLLQEEPITSHEQAKTLERQRHQLSDWLHDLHRLPQSERKTLAKQLRHWLKRSRQRLDQAYDQWQAERQAIIEQAAQAAELDDLQQAIEQAKALQARWNRIPHLPRKREQPLWRAFRKHCDAIFARREAEKQAEKTEQAHLRQQAQALVEQLQALDFAQVQNNEALQAQEQALQAIRDAWREQTAPPADLQAAFDQQLRETLQQQNTARMRIEQARFLTRLSALAADSDPTLRAKWSAHWQDAWQKGSEQSADESILQMQVLEVEILADQPSPETDHEQRLEAQVALVQKKHDGQLPEEAQLPEWLLLRWLQAGGGQLPSSHPLQVRFLQAMQAWFSHQDPG